MQTCSQSFHYRTYLWQRQQQRSSEVSWQFAWDYSGATFADSAAAAATTLGAISTLGSKVLCFAAWIRPGSLC